MKTIETYLPVFQGLYGTLLEFDDEEGIINSYNEENGTDFNYDNFNWRYAPYNIEVAKECVTVVENLLKEHGIVKTIKFQELYSPREYNFSNDSINVEVKLNKKELVKYVKENIEAFETYIKEHFTSCIGFSSFFTNNHLEWLKQLKTWKFENETTQVGAILSFISEHLIGGWENCTTSEWLYYGVMEGQCFEPEYEVKE